MQTQLDYIFFVYGFAFLFLGVTCYTRKTENLKHRFFWLCLSGFGFTHGTNEWLDLIAHSLKTPDFFAFCRVFILGISFGFLLLSPVVLCGDDNALRKRLRMAAVAWCGIVFIFALWLAHGGETAKAQVLIRWLIGLPGSLLAGIALWQVGQGNRWLMVSASSFFVYAIASGMVTPPENFFPASVINTKQFAAIAGFPVQLLRCLLAVVAAVCIWKSRQAPKLYGERKIYQFNQVVFTLSFAVAWWLLQTVGENAWNKEIEEAKKVARTISIMLDHEPWDILSNPAQKNHHAACKGVRDSILKTSCFFDWIDHFYILIKKDENIVFLMDLLASKNADKMSLCSYGQKILFEEDFFKSIFSSSKGSVSHIYNGRLGLPHLTVASPICDKSGAVRGILGLDIHPDKLETVRANARLTVLGYLMFAAVVFLVYFFYRNQTAHLIGTNILANELNHKLSLVVERSPVALMITDCHGNIEYVNGEFELMTEFPREEVMGKNPRILRSGVTSPDVYVELWRTITAGNVWKGEVCNKKKSGSLYWEHILVSPLKNENGETTHYVSVKKDVTDRKALEEELKSSDAFSKQIIESSPNCIKVLDMQGRLQFMSQSGQRKLKIEDITQFLGMPYIEFWTGSEMNAVKATLEQALKGKPSGFTGFCPTCDQVPKWWDVQVSPIFDPSGNVCMLLVVSRDITERKKMEDDLLEAKEAAEKANRAKSDFLAMMSHDLRTPLNAIIGYSDILSEEKNLTDAQKEQIGTISYCGNSLLSLINDILDISKIEAGKLDLVNEPFDLKTLLEDVCRTLDHQVHNKSLFLKTEGMEKSSRLLADSGRIRQILFNLLSNAIKFTEKGGVLICVKKEKRPDGKLFFKLEIKDTGAGILPEELEKLFAPFSQSESGRRKHGGTGLGLVICQNIARKMGGDVVLESVLGQGTRATFSFEALPDNKQPKVIATVREVIPRNEKVRVLVVDDMPSNQRLFKTILNNITPHVDTASSGVEAVTMAEQSVYTHFLVDILMPEMDGVECMRQIKLVHKSKALYVTSTALVMAESKETYLEAGFDRYISKPTNLDEFRDIFGNIS